MPDPEVLAVVQRLEGGLSQELDVVIGTTEHRPRQPHRRRALAGGRHRQPHRRRHPRRHRGRDRLINGGGIRGEPQYPAGAKLTRRDILSELPFGNTTVLVELTGADLKAALENGFSQTRRTAPGRFPQVSGLMIEVDEQAPRGSRRGHRSTVGGEPLDPGQNLPGRHQQLPARGRRRLYGAGARGEALIGATDGKRVANEVMAYIRRLGTVDIRPEGRISSDERTRHGRAGALPD